MRCSRAYFSRVAVLGAAGGIGQPLALLLKNNAHVKELKLYDIKGAPGVAADLSHICSSAKVTGYSQEELNKAVQNTDLVLIPAGVPRKPGMTRDDLFNTNAGIVRDLVTAVARAAPKAIIGVISNPVNSTVPVAAETLKKLGAYDPGRLFGVTTLDVVRARTFVAEALGRSPYDIDVPVVGGHSGETIVPLLSGFPSLSKEQVEQLTYRIQFGGDEVVKAKSGAGSATLSMAHAGNEWATAVLRALSGEKGVTVCTYVESSVEPSCTFFSSPVELGKNGVEKIHCVPKLNAYEEKLMAKCLEGLQGNIKKGVAFGCK
ncbi:malate dehydrogenase [Leishmania braziliensis MHOM/BR/75/M2904]|uniref:Malate dehydrogenase n=3 Tax=Leishmania braziliensis species complex TaxID=37617 RepID=A4HAC0_LEIBR|nr:malate dehydrogenase [Leishmania braziliensis MHOM/BR/75/M2904]ABU25171.1 malate dehydrogenase [Leishmania peruviana]ABY50459.1 malate dehydrogenase [Leishmania braziliensis]ABY50472.1 malate dehydrogenase [Leishmania peruviana]ABY50473.1 malate dehydrogenase [Leishmania peruviana]ABY50474.1 malate dehydrogenase [Leishmania peruviana]